MVTPPPPDDDARRDRILTAASGYAELGLPDMAWDELRALTDDDRRQPDVQEFSIALLVREERWAEAVAAGHPLCADSANSPALFIHTAFALHELGRTPEARALLLAGPGSLHADPLYHYNMACYLAVCGELNDAADSLRTAFRMDSKLRAHATTDPDLKKLQDVL